MPKTAAVALNPRANPRLAGQRNANATQAEAACFGARWDIHLLRMRALDLLKESPRGEDDRL